MFLMGSSAPAGPGFHLVQPALEALAHPPEHAGSSKERQLILP